MTRRSVVITDTERGVHVADFRAAESAELRLAGSRDWSVARHTLRGGRSDGVDVIEVDNGALRLRVLPTRGMGIWNGELGGVPIGWRSPVELPVHPRMVDLSACGGLGWLSGFNELLCRCGLAWNGPPGSDPAGGVESMLTLHGRIANTPAHHVTVTISDEGPGVIEVTGVVDEAMLFGSRLRLTATIRSEVGSHRWQVLDTVTNLSARDAELELLYHLNLGEPFLDDGARIVAAVREVAPRDQVAAAGVEQWHQLAGPTPGYAEQVYFLLLIPDAKGAGTVLLRNAAGDRGLSVTQDLTGLPCFTLWKNTAAAEDGYVVGLEPGTDLPHPRDFERSHGRVMRLPPGASYTTSVEVAVHDDAEAVQRMETGLLATQEGVTPRIHAHPTPPFSPR